MLESTVYPGVTAQTWLPIIEELGLVIGEDLEIAYCPERFNPGDAAHGVRQVARVIGCTNPDVGQALVALVPEINQRRRSLRRETRSGRSCKGHRKRAAGHQHRSCERT